MISDQEEGEINLTTNNKREEEEEQQQLSPNELMRKLEIIKDIKFVSP
jgi:hypothetical protein